MCLHGRLQQYVELGEELAQKSSRFGLNVAESRDRGRTRIDVDARPQVADSTA